MITKMYIDSYIEYQDKCLLLKDTAFSVNEKGFGILASESNTDLCKIKNEFNLILVEKTPYSRLETYIESEILFKVLDCKILSKNISNYKIEIQFKGNLTWEEL